MISVSVLKSYSIIISCYTVREIPGVERTIRRGQGQRPEGGWPDGSGDGGGGVGQVTWLPAGSVLALRLHQP